LGMRKSDGNSYLYMLWNEFCAVSDLAYYFFIESWDILRKLPLGLRTVHSRRRLRQSAAVRSPCSALVLA